MTEISVPTQIEVLSRIENALDGGLNICEALKAVEGDVADGSDGEGDPEVSAAISSILVRHQDGFILSACLREWTLESERSLLNQAVDQSRLRIAGALRTIIGRLERRPMATT